MLHSGDCWDFFPEPSDLQFQPQKLLHQVGAEISPPDFSSCSRAGCPDVCREELTSRVHPDLRGCGWDLLASLFHVTCHHILFLEKIFQKKSPEQKVLWMISFQTLPAQVPSYLPLQHIDPACHQIHCSLWKAPLLLITTFQAIKIH